MKRSAPIVFNSIKAAYVEPTADEYDEARTTDLDPQTFDKATYHRIRKLGVSHSDIINSNKSGVSLEDLETALENNNGDYTKALDEAHGYDNYYKQQINYNQGLSRFDKNFAGDLAKKFTQDRHDKAVSILFGHQMALRNAPEDWHTGWGTDQYGVDASTRKSGQTWLMRQCAKLVPSLGARINDTAFDSTMVQHNYSSIDPEFQSRYHSMVDHLLKHYSYSMVTSGTLKDYKTNLRKHNIVLSLAPNMFYPTNYTPEVSEG